MTERGIHVANWLDRSKTVCGISLAEDDIRGWNVADQATCQECRFLAKGFGEGVLADKSQVTVHLLSMLNEHAPAFISAVDRIGRSLEQLAHSFNQTDSSK